jgi:hypothetical protein
MTDDDIAKHIDQLPDPIEFVTPYFAFARAIEEQARREALEQAARICDEAVNRAIRADLQQHADAAANLGIAIASLKEPQ